MKEKREHRKNKSIKFHFVYRRCLLKRDDFDRLIAACKTIGGAVYYPTNSGMTISGTDYLPISLIQNMDEIQKSLDVLNAFFGPNRNSNYIEDDATDSEAVKAGIQK